MSIGLDNNRHRGRSTGKRRADEVLIALILLAILLIAFAGYWTLGRIQTQLKQQIAQSLQTVVATTQEGIGIWVNSTKDRISVIAQRSEVISAVEAQVGLEHKLLQPSAALLDLRRFLSPVLEERKYDFSVVAPDWIQIAAQSDDEVGKELPAMIDRSAIVTAFTGQIGVGLSSIQTGTASESLTVAAPVRDSTGRILAVLVLYLHPEQDFDLVTHFGRIGTTGETYIFDQNGRMLTSSRFRPDGNIYVREALLGSDVTPPFTKMAQSALSAKSGVDVEGYLDYRGIYVFGAWSWDPVLKVGIATEIDRSEALTPYRSIRAFTLLMLAVTGGVFAALLAVVRRRNRILANNVAFQESIKARQDTLAVVSHDLRAPLNNVLLCSNMITSVNCDPDLSRLTGMINRSSRQMEKLISDLLDVSEIEMGRLRIEKKRCEIPAVLEAIRDTFSEFARSKSIDLRIAVPEHSPSLNADPDRLIQVVSNLVGNALKFTPNGGEVQARATVLPSEIRFEVQDTGPGIPEDAIPYVFEQFWKTKSSGRRGRGLGLYIAKMIVELHDGKIWVESDGRTGSTFCFTIPF